MKFQLKVKKIKTFFILVFKFSHQMILKKTLLNIILLSTSLPVFAFDKLYSEHFTVVYKPGLKKQAQETLSIYESLFETRKKFFDWEPEGTYILLKDGGDISNGSSTPLPFNHNTLFTYPPTFGELQNKKPWLEIVATHEQVHLFHMDKVKGAPALAQKIFGRNPLMFPNAAQPSFFLEGLAVFLEGGLDNRSSRGVNGTYDAILRAHYLKEGKFWDSSGDVYFAGDATLDRANANYYLGYNFFEFLDTTYKSNTIKKLVDNYSDNLIPFLVDFNLKTTVKDDNSVMWGKFNKYLTNKYTKQINKIKALGIEKKTLISIDVKNALGTTVAVKKSSNNKDEIYYSSHDGRSWPTLNLYQSPISNKKITADIGIGSGSFIGDMDYHPTQGLLLSQYDGCRIYNPQLIYSLYKLHGSSLKKLMSCARYKNIRWSKDGRSFYASKFDPDKFVFKIDQISSKNYKVIDNIFTAKYSYDINTFDLNPKGDKIIFTQKKPFYGWVIKEINLKTKQVKSLVDNGRIITTALYGKKGKYLYFDAKDDNKVINIFRLNLATKKISQLTNTLTLAKLIKVSDNKIYYTEMTKNIDSLYSLDLDKVIKKNPFPALEKVQNPLKTVINKQGLKIARNAKTGSYNFLETFYPRSWLFNFQNRSASIIVDATDLTAKHKAALTLTGYLGEDKKETFFTNGSLAYSYNNMLSLAFANNTIVGDRVTDNKYTKPNGNGGRTIPFKKDEGDGKIISFKTSQTLSAEFSQPLYQSFQSSLGLKFSYLQNQTTYDYLHDQLNKKELDDLEQKKVRNNESDAITQEVGAINLNFSNVYASRKDGIILGGFTFSSRLETYLGNIDALKKLNDPKNIKENPYSYIAAATKFFNLGAGISTKLTLASGESFGYYKKDFFEFGGDSNTIDDTVATNSKYDTRLFGFVTGIDELRGNKFNYASLSLSTPLLFLDKSFLGFALHRVRFNMGIDTVQIQITPNSYIYPDINDKNGLAARKILNSNWYSTVYAGLDFDARIAHLPIKLSTGYAQADFSKIKTISKKRGANSVYLVFTLASQ